MIKTLKKRTRKKLFTTPSHAQKFCIFSKLKQLYKYDISEVDEYNPQEALKKSQQRAAKIYGTNYTYYLTNGSTSGIIAAVLACVKQGEKVLIWNKAHRCHENAVKLAGGIPVYYNLEKDNEWGIYKSAPTSIIKKDVKAIIVTSPTYYGITSDIEALSKLCKQYGVFLIVDEAHGALYPFGLNKSAICQGADFVIQSLHKTAGGLNPTALLHNNTNRDVQPFLDMITTTSPSYPLLASIEKNINYLNSSKGRKKIKELIKNIENLKEDVKTVDFLQGHDITKIVIKKQGMSGFELSEFLFKNNIEDEITNEKSTMLLCGIGTDKKMFTHLKNVLNKL